jgi:3-hydroxyisobutyrate dehydrogenase-like beta-hydroxyacid dehydrogenase
VSHPVTVIGGGPMALAIGSALLHTGTGTAVTVWNRTPARMEDVVASGARLAGSAAEAVVASPVSLINVVDHDALDAILGTLGSLEGRLVVGLCSDVPARARRTATLVADLGGRYLDGSVMTPAETIGGPAGSLLVSGPHAHFDEAQPLLERLGKTTWVGEDVGAAATIDITGLDFFWTAVSGYLHALTVADREGVTAGELLPHAQGMVAIMPPILDDLASRVADRRHDGATASLDSVRTSVDHIAHTAQAHRLDTSALDGLARALDRAKAAGHGADEISRLVEHLSDASQAPTQP